MNTPNLLGIKNPMVRSFFNNLGRSVYRVEGVMLNPMNNPIGNVLSQKINERQDNTINGTPATSSDKERNNSMEELVKLKSLLDQGIITQEEFETKKKQLLGL